jgi:hypothetical protein
VEARDGADRQQPTCSSVTKALEAPCPPRYACKSRPISKCSTSYVEFEESYYMPDDYYSEESGYDLDMFRKNWEDDF